MTLRDKKLVVNETEAETVRTIFRLYLELKSLNKLAAELDRRRIVTKRRHTKVAKYNGAIPFTYGPLAYLLKNRVYVGETHHGGKWFKGEHKAILDRGIFERIQALLKTNANGSRIKHFDSGALLQGKLYDDKGNLMGPSFSTKNGVRYRFYVSSALRHGRRKTVGSVGRVPAQQIEDVVRSALVSHQQAEDVKELSKVFEELQRVVVDRNQLSITIADADNGHASLREIKVPWCQADRSNATVFDRDRTSEGGWNERLIRAIIRSHAWLRKLEDGTYDSVEELAEADSIHPKVIRQAIRLAFLPPEMTSTILENKQPTTLSLAGISKLRPLSWAIQRRQPISGT